MDDLISRKAAIQAIADMALGKCVADEETDDNKTCEEKSAMFKAHQDSLMAIRHLPSVPAVPLDKLCEWLAEHSVNIPCETCRNFSNDYCTAIGDMDKPCPNKAEDWQMAIKGWMEGLDGTD